MGIKAKRMRFVGMLAALCATVALSLGGSVSSQAGAGDKYRLVYSIYSSGFEVLQAEVMIKSDPSYYDVQVQAQTVGLFQRLAPWETSAKAEGLYAQDEWLGAGLRPEGYQLTNVWRGRTRQTELVYDEMGGVQFQAQPSYDDPPMDESLVKYTVDPLSAVIGILNHAARSEKCETSMPIYDGRRRFNLIAKPIPARYIEKSSYTVYHGPSVGCALDVKPVAGKWKDPRAEEGKKIDPVKLYLGRLEQTGTVAPVRLEAPTRYGFVIAHLDRVEKIR